MPTKDYQALIFDCDGTLTDSMPVHYVAWHRTMLRYGIQFPEDRFYALGGVPSDKIIRLLATEQRVAVDSQRVALEKEEAFLELLHLLEPIVPVLAVAEHFRHRVPMVVASGGFRDVIQRQLQQIGCADWFDSIVAAEDTERHKPEPDVFLEAARRVGAEPSKCLVYEDSELGIVAAKAAGMDYVDVRTFFSPKRIAVSQVCSNLTLRQSSLARSGLTHIICATEAGMARLSSRLDFQYKLNKNRAHRPSLTSRV